MATVENMTITVTIEQPALRLNEVAAEQITQEDIIIFGRWMTGDKGDQGDPGVGIPQTISLSDHTLTLSDGGGSVELPEGFSGNYNDLTNKPTLGTAAAKDVPSSGNASSSQVVLGSDSRLNDARTPTAHTHTKSQITDFPDIPSQLDDLSDVQIQSPTSGKVLKYNGSKWVPGDVAAGSSALSQLTDVALDNLSDGQTLKYNSTTQEWENAEAGADDYICTLTVTSLGESEQSISCDKSVSEIISAYSGGKKVYAKWGVEDGEYAINFIFPLTTIYEEDGTRAVYFANNIFVILNTGIWFFVGVEQNGQDTWSQEEMYSYTMKEKLDNIESYAQVNVQSDWNESDTSDDAYIKNKPTLGTAAALDVAESGNASTSQVVKGDDSRLSDSRNAADVYAWAKAATKPSYSASEVGAIASSEKGANNGVAELDATGKVPSSQLPSYVDDVLEYASQGAFPATGETGKIYIALDTNKTYRWGGSSYTEISASLALGETSSTAYAGNKGKANADAIAAIKDGSTIDSFADVEAALEANAVSGTNDGTNWTTITIGSVTKNIPSGGGGGGLSDYDFDHSDNSSVSVSTTVTFAANTRGSKMITTSGNLSVAFAVNNESDNYLWIKNSGSSEIDIAVTVSWKGTALTSTQIYKPDDGISIPAGMVCEIGIVCNNDGAFITSRNDLNIETT